MPRKPDMLNVRKHLLHVQQVLDSVQQYGAVPLVMHNLAQASLINRAIMRKHQIKRDAGDRHDIRPG